MTLSEQWRRILADPERQADRYQSPSLPWLRLRAQLPARLWQEARAQLLGWRSEQGGPSQ